MLIDIRELQSLDRVGGYSFTRNSDEFTKRTIDDNIEIDTITGKITFKLTTGSRDGLEFSKILDFLSDLVDTQREIQSSGALITIRDNLRRSSLIACEVERFNRRK